MVLDSSLFIHFFVCWYLQFFYYLESFENFEGYGDLDYLDVFGDSEDLDDPENFFDFEDFVHPHTHTALFF